MPSPSKEEMDSDVFNAIWDIIKKWDIGYDEYYTGYTSGNGSHVKILIDALKPVLRNNRIDEILIPNYTSPTNANEPSL
jgi:hypothetical protein